MQKILKSVVTLAALLAITTSATGAYFTSSVVAPDNVITTGTLLVAVDSAQEDTFVGTWGYPNAYEVVRENADGSYTLGMPFIPWTGAAPDDTHTYTVGVRNNGTIPLNFRAAAVGGWVSGPRFGTAACVGMGVGGSNVEANGTNSDASLVSVSNVHLYAATVGGGCESDFGCRNLRDGLLTGPWTPVAGLTAGDVANPTGWYYGTTLGTDGTSGGSFIALNEGEFAVYQVTTTLDADTNNCYQGATYNFDFNVQGKQVDASWL